MMRKPRILVIDDGEDYARVVAERLPEFALVQPDGAARVADGPAALAYLARHRRAVDVVLLDLQFNVSEAQLLPLGNGVSSARTRRFQGIAILRALRARFPDLPVVLLTAEDSVSLIDVDREFAAQSLTYFLDAENIDTLRIRINAAFQESAQGLEDGGVLWGADRDIQGIRRRLAVLARGSLPIILEGETGTGKSYLAEHFVHRNSGRTGAFITADLASVPQDLVAAYLFGSERGAFTGAVADRKGVFALAQHGTLFLDEMQNASLEIQKQLLVVLQDQRMRPVGSAQTQPVDVKIIAGSNAALDAAVRAGHFRQDLYMRLNPATRLVLPPLRERREDIPFLAKRFVEVAGQDANHSELIAVVAKATGAAPTLRLSLDHASDDNGLALALPAAAFTLLKAHGWPGNLRELAMVMHNVVTLTLVAAVDALRGGLTLRRRTLEVDPGLVGQLLQPMAAGTTRTPRYAVELVAQPSLSAVATHVERQYFRELYDSSDGDFAEMAALLLGDRGKARAVRLRFNQIGLRVRDMRRAPSPS